MNPVLAILERNGATESVHRGMLSVVRGDEELLALGDTGTRHYPRSALKPFQAIPLLEEGLDRSLGLSDQELTVMTASHCGDDSHVAVVRGLLDKVGIAPEALGCGVHRPLDARAARALDRHGQEPTVLHHNCSGKHTGMLILARHLGAPLEGYLDPDHPAQRRIRDSVARFTGVPAADLAPAVDGCSAPAFLLSVRALALGMARFASPDTLPEPTRRACGRLFEAVQREPHMLAGRRILDTALIRAGHGRIFCKRGAEGVLALAVQPSAPGEAGIGIAIKIEDGAMRGYFPAVVRTLECLGIPWENMDPDHLPSMADGRVTNHRQQEVGRLRPGVALQDLAVLRR